MSTGQNKGVDNTGRREASVLRLGRAVVPFDAATFQASKTKRFVVDI